MENIQELQSIKKQLLINFEEVRMKENLGTEENSYHKNTLVDPSRKFIPHFLILITAQFWVSEW